MERTVGAALRGRPWFKQCSRNQESRVWRIRFQTTGGHGGPPLQYVLQITHISALLAGRLGWRGVRG